MLLLPSRLLVYLKEEMTIITKQHQVTVQPKPNPGITWMHNSQEIYRVISMDARHKIVTVMHTHLTPSL
jgi:hypothetical protein